MYPILWALEHAPVVDAEERAILAALVNKGDFDGCNCYRSYPVLAKVAKVDPKTAQRRCHAMEKRGVIRRQPGPKPRGWLQLPKDKRPVVWEAMIPASFWSAVQLDEVNQARAERDRVPITAESRPDLSEAPPKKARADKGTKRPNRSKKSRGDSQSGRSDASGGTDSPVAGGLTVRSRGDYKSPNPPMSPSDSPSSPPTPPAPEDATEGDDIRSGGEDGNPAPDTAASGRLRHAEGLVNDAVSRWGRAHRAPSPRDRQRLSERVAAELEAGGDEAVILHELTRDMGDVRRAVNVMLGDRTALPGWGQRTNDPRPDARAYEPTGPRPPWCGACDERTRLVAYERGDGSEGMRRCRRCHPEAAERENAGGPEPSEVDEGELDGGVLDAMRASMAGAPAPTESGGMSEGARTAAAAARERLAALQRQP